MTERERKLYRPTTVKNNIINLVKGIRGTNVQIAERRAEGNNCDGLQAQVRSYKKNLKAYWQERKLNAWTN